MVKPDKATLFKSPVFSFSEPAEHYAKVHFFSNAYIFIWFLESVEKKLYGIKGFKFMLKLLENHQADNSQEDILGMLFLWM